MTNAVSFNTDGVVPEALFLMPSAPAHPRGPALCAVRVLSQTLWDIPPCSSSNRADRRLEISAGHNTRYDGPIELESVLDEDLRVIGTQHLYACDMSVMPFSSAANPVRTLVALALRLSKHFG